VTFVDVARAATLGVRYLVAGAFLLSVIVAATHALVRRGTLAAFGGWARFVRGWSDPLLRPIERRLVRAGGNPQEAPLWLAGLTLVLGLVLIWFTGWLFTQLYYIGYASQAGPRVAAQIAVHYLFSLLELAILVRVVVSWFGVSPHARWLRPFAWLTDWLIEPIRRVLPPFGMLDMSPLAAYLVLYLVERLVMGAFF
jgi:YggT family protein